MQVLCVIVCVLVYFGHGNTYICCCCECICITEYLIANGANNLLYTINNPNLDNSLLIYILL